MPSGSLGRVVPKPEIRAGKRALAVEVHFLWTKIRGPGQVQLRCRRRHSVGCFIQRFGHMALHLDESCCGASRSPPVIQADHMCQQLTPRVTMRSECKIFPLSAFEQIHATQTIFENGKILIYRAVLTR